MSFDFGLAIAPDTTVEDFIGAASLSSETTPFTEFHTDGSTVGIAQIGDHVVLLDEFYVYPIPLLEAWSQRTGNASYLLMFGDTSDVYVLQAFGPEPRAIVRSVGEVTEENGIPLAVETAPDGAVEEFASDRHIALFERILGMEFSHVLEAEFATLEIDPDAEINFPLRA
jgi:hypothetical protein